MRWYAHPNTVTHRSINWARRTVTSLICPTSVPLCLRWPSIPKFPGQSRFLMTCPRQNSVLPVLPSVQLCAWCPRFAHLCSRMLMHRWPNISSDFICMYKKIAGGQGSIPDLAGGADNAPPDPQVGPRWLAPVALTPYNSCLQRSFRTAVPKLWSP